MKQYQRAGINIEGLDKAEILIALYNNARTQGIGKSPLRVEESMSRETALRLLQSRDYFDYIDGRVLKVDLSGNVLDPWLYDRDNGKEVAERIIAKLRR